MWVFKDFFVVYVQCFESDPDEISDDGLFFEIKLDD